MGGSIQVPNNIEDKTVLKRFLTDLVLGINSNTLFSGNAKQQNEAIVEILQNNPTLDFLNLVSKLTELRADILTYVEDNIETIILQNTEDIALIAEQFGTFYNQALAASWYGLSVKAGGAVAGLEVGSLDPDVTTPGDESSYFRVVANNFILGRAYEDLTQAEKDYLSTNNLPNFGTVYNASKQPVPALVTTWDGANQVYKHYFNGIVQFSNISGADYANAINNGTTTINGGKITTGSITANQIAANTITSDKIRTYNLTSVNAVIQNGLITTAKIGDAQITNAKIANLSVDTLKIQDEAVVIPRFANGTGSCEVVYTPTTSHNCIITIFISCYPEFTFGPGFDYILRINGSIVKRLTGQYYTQLNYLQHFVYLNAGTTYTFNFTTLDGNSNVISTESSLVMLGVKK